MIYEVGIGSFAPWGLVVVVALVLNVDLAIVARNPKKTST